MSRPPAIARIAWPSAIGGVARKIETGSPIRPSTRSGVEIEVGESAVVPMRRLPIAYDRASPVRRSQTYYAHVLVAPRDPPGMLVERPRRAQAALEGGLHRGVLVAENPETASEALGSGVRDVL